MPMIEKCEYFSEKRTALKINVGNEVPIICMVPCCSHPDRGTLSLQGNCHGHKKSCLIPEDFRD